MHDYHAVSALIEQLRSELGDAALDDVSEVRILADALFSPQALLQAYEMLTPGTPLEGSRLVVEEALRDRDCRSCGWRWTPTRDDLAGHVVLCPSCGALSPADEDAGGILVTAVSHRSTDEG